MERLVGILEVVRVETHVGSPFGTLSGGRQMHDRRCLARAFVAKAVYDLPTTECLIELLHNHRLLRAICGWDSRKEVPSSPTFSRAFAEFKDELLGDRVHAALVAEHVKTQADLGRDSTEVVARERPAKKEKKVKIPKKRGRPKKGEVRPGPEPKRLDIQLRQSAEDAIRALPKVCDWGTKMDTGGHAHTWKGYKAHIDCTEHGLPVGVVTTSASVHDSQVAIPLARRTAKLVKSGCELMDSAYDAPQIRQAIKDLGHIPVIDPNRRRGGVPEEKVFDPETAERYKKRTACERVNSRLKDEFGLRHVRVRGNPKVHLHIMFGVIALFADQLLKPFSG